MAAYIGEIRLFAGAFAPVNWQCCNGQLLPISDYDALFTLIGTTYGGDGQATFALPDLQGRVPVHFGTNPGTRTAYIIGESAGVEAVTLTTQTLTMHSHALQASIDQARSTNPGNAVLGQGPTAYSQFPPSVTLANGTLMPIGRNEAHDNVQPFQCLTFIICAYGVYPEQG